MLAAGILIIFAGYSVSSWGYCLIKGYDIPLRQWVSPLHPFVWPSGDPPLIPQTQVWPSSKSAAASTAADSASSPGTQPGRATQPAPGASGAFGTVPVRSQ